MSDDVPEHFTGLQWIPAGQGGQLLLWEAGDQVRHHLEDFGDLPEGHRARRIIEREGGPDSVVQWDGLDEEE